MTDGLTERIAEVLGAHVSLNWWGECCCGAWQSNGEEGSFATHQAEQVRAVLGETTTEWCVDGEDEEGEWSSGVTDRRDGAEEFQKRNGGRVVRREVIKTPWAEVSE